MARIVVETAFYDFCILGEGYSEKIIMNFSHKE